jgi:glucose/arabinose dehydrogenase
MTNFSRHQGLLSLAYPLSCALALAATPSLVGCDGGSSTTGGGNNGQGAASQGGGGQSQGGGGQSQGGGGQSQGGGGQSQGGGGQSQGGGGQGGGGPDCQPGTGALPALEANVVASGFDFPVAVAAAPGDDTHLFVVEVDGYIRVVENGNVVSTFLDVDAGTVSNQYQGDERGLLGLAFHPDYAQNGRFFIFRTKQNGNNAIEEYHRSAGDPLVADPAPVATLVETTNNQGNHNGGGLAFGPDGMLYIGVGDGGGSGDPGENGQDIDDLHGKLLRVDVDTYPTPPAGNLPGGNPHIWDYGLRNPWRFSFDACSGDLYIGDVGQNAWEEIDVEPAGQGNKNYGWDDMEGTHCFEPMNGCNMDGKTMPVIEHSHNDGVSSITGGYVYRGAAIPALRGRYVYGDFVSGKIFSFRHDAGQALDFVDLTQDLAGGSSYGFISSFGEDNQGNLYILDYYGGTVARIDAE